MAAYYFRPGPSVGAASASQGLFCSKAQSDLVVYAILSLADEANVSERLGAGRLRGSSEQHRHAVAVAVRPERRRGFMAQRRICDELGAHCCKRVEPQITKRRLLSSL